MLKRVQHDDGLEAEERSAGVLSLAADVQAGGYGRIDPAACCATGLNLPRFRGLFHA
ncbi:hypothetical protein GGQ81_002998 [Sphingomonas desiccabilis]|nr:hypothetical protein [Sphingomonas desiccabilis]